MEEKPKMYQNKINKEFHNNKLVYMSNNQNNKNTIYDINDIRKKINDIINSNSFIYYANVHIILDNDTIIRKIIGINNNNLVTIDNEYIPIENIKDIYK